MKTGIIPVSEGFYSFIENRYIYNYKDHLGNTRVTFAKNNAGMLESIDTNNYYPFGLNHIGGSSYSKFGSYYNYKYNGKELQETGMYDYGARFYMPDIGRWGVVDPLADIHPNMTPFRYSFNNPINVIDPTGLLEDDWELNAVTGDLKKVTENDKPDVLYVVNEKGKRITDKGNTVKFTMERDEQIEEREIVSENVKYNPKPGVDGEKEVKYESYKFDNQSKGKSFFEFLAKYSNAGNEFDLFQYTQNGIDKALVGRTLQFSYLTRFTQDSNNPKQYDFGGFLPSIGLKTGLYNRTSNLPGVDSSKNIFTHSHPGDGKNPEASPADINTAKYNSLPGIFNVYSGGVYKEIPRK